MTVSTSAALPRRDAELTPLLQSVRAGAGRLSSWRSVGSLSHSCSPDLTLDSPRLRAPQSRSASAHGLMGAEQAQQSRRVAGKRQQLGKATQIGGSETLRFLESLEADGIDDFIRGLREDTL
jgi:hypothetical protein